MFDQILAHPGASLMALFGMLCMVGWPMARTRRTMLIVQIGIGVGFGLHYALLGLLTASAVNALGALQIAIALRFGERPDRRWLNQTLIVAVVGTACVTWQGLPTLAAAAGTLLIAIGRAQTDAFKLRAFVLAGYPFWVLHDLVVGSPVIIADVASLIVGAAMLIRAAPPKGMERRHRPHTALLAALLRRRPERGDALQPHNRRR